MMVGWNIPHALANPAPGSWNGDTARPVHQTVRVGAQTKIQGWENNREEDAFSGGITNCVEDR